MADPTQSMENIHFVNERERMYFAEASLGIEVQQFLESTVGRYLHGCAKQEYDQARSDAFELDPYTPEGKKKWQELQNKARAAEHFMRWCVEAIQAGKNAEMMLGSNEDEQ